MKRLFLLLVAIVMVAGAASAQTVKFGKVNIDSIVALMPEADSIQIKLQKRSTELRDQVGQMSEELNKKAAAFEKDSPNLSGLILEQRRNEVIDLNQKLEQFAASAEQDLAQYQQQLSAPLFKKVQDAIAKVSKLQGMAFVVEENQVPFIYYDATKFKDITTLVKSELKLKDKK